MRPIKLDPAKPFPLYAATGNPNKIIDIQAASDEMFGGALRIAVPRLALPAHVENQKTFLANAIAKAEAAAKITEQYVIADDSGFCVAALGGEPGLRSARWRQEHGEERADQAVLEQLNGSASRSAYFLCAAAIVDPAGKLLACGEARLNGRISTAVRGELKFGFGRILVPKGEDATYAELDQADRDYLNPRPVVIKDVLWKAFRTAEAT